MYIYIQYIQYIYCIYTVYVYMHIMMCSKLYPRFLLSRHLGVRRQLAQIWWPRLEKMRLILEYSSLQKVEVRKIM